MDTARAKLNIMAPEAFSIPGGIRAEGAAFIEDTAMKEKRDLVYWKARQVDLRNCIAMTKPTKPYWADLWQAYRFAARHVEQIERRMLVKHHV